MVKHNPRNMVETKFGKFRSLVFLSGLHVAVLLVGWSAQVQAQTGRRLNPYEPSPIPVSPQVQQYQKYLRGLVGPMDWKQPLPGPSINSKSLPFSGPVQMQMEMLNNLRRFNAELDNPKTSPARRRHLQQGLKRLEAQQRGITTSNQMMGNVTREQQRLRDRNYGYECQRRADYYYLQGDAANSRYWQRQANQFLYKKGE